MDLFFRKVGSGPPLVIVHGLYGSSDNWITIARNLAPLFTVYTVDQRNHGRSPFAGSHSYNDMKNDLATFFERQSIEKATLLGHSMGGKTAMWFASDYPEKVEKLIVADIAPKNYLEIEGESQFGLHQNILWAMKDIDFGRIESREEIEEYLLAKIDDVRTCQFLVKNTERDKQTKLFKWKLNVDVLYDYLEEIVGGVNAKWFEERAPITRYPVHFIRGGNSGYISLQDERLISEIYPEARITTIPGAGHWLHAEQPELFIRAVLS